jgi:SAM-dependent methyltransferase
VPFTADSDSAHNIEQRTYFEATLKKTMVPADTPYLRRHVEELIRFGGLSSGDRVLEVGCGMGRYTLLLARRGLRVDAMDLSAVLLDRLREYAGPGFAGTLHAADIEAPPPGLTGPYDSVIALFALHHMENLPNAFTSMYRLVKPGGRVVFLEPNPYNPLFYVQMLVTPSMTWKGDGGIIKMRRRVIFDALRAAGFTEPAMARFGFLPPFVVNHAAGANAEAALERVPLWRALLPFQLFRARRPPDAGA